MDTLTHALMGTLACSRTGLAGGRRGAFKRKTGAPRVVDWTFWGALCWGVFPDAASLGLFLIPNFLAMGHGVWREMPGYIFILYNLTHSLIVAFFVIAAVWRFRKPFAVTMLAWPLHILSDMLTHGEGRFSTPILYPLSDYRFRGVNWWENPWLSKLPLSLCIGLLVLVLVIRWIRVPNERIPLLDKDLQVE